MSKIEINEESTLCGYTLAFLVDYIQANGEKIDAAYRDYQVCKHLEKQRAENGIL